MEVDELTRALEHAASRLQPASPGSRAMVARRVLRQRRRRAIAAVAGVVLASVGVGAAISADRSTSHRIQVATGAPPEEPLIVYSDRSLGFSLSYPQAWRATPFAHQCMIEATGVVIANVARPMSFQQLGPNACTTNFDTTKLPSNFVFVALFAHTRFGGIHPDTPLPVLLEPTLTTAAGGVTSAGVVVYHAGGADSIWAEFGPTATAADRRRAEQIAASLIFLPASQAIVPTTTTTLATALSPPPPVMISADIDGDGRPDTVTLTTSPGVGFHDWHVQARLASGVEADLDVGFLGTNGKPITPALGVVRLGTDRRQQILLSGLGNDSQLVDILVYTPTGGLQLAQTSNGIALAYSGAGHNCCRK